MSIRVHSRVGSRGCFRSRMWVWGEERGEVWPMAAERSLWIRYGCAFSVAGACSAEIISVDDDVDDSSDENNYDIEIDPEDNDPKIDHLDPNKDDLEDLDAEDDASIETLEDGSNRTGCLWYISRMKL